MTTNNTTTKKTIGQTSTKTAPVAKPATAPVAKPPVAPPVKTTAVATAQEPEKPVTNTTPVVSPVPEKEGKKRGGGLTKEQREAKEKELKEIRGTMISDLLKKQATGAISSEDLSKAMIDLESSVTEEYKRRHPGATAERKGDPLWRAKVSAQILVGHFQKKFPEVSKEDMIKFFQHGFDNPVIRERPDLKGKAPGKK